MAQSPLEVAAAARSANSEAIGHFTRALDLLALRDSKERRERELTLLTSLGSALMRAKGQPDPDVSALLTKYASLFTDRFSNPAQNWEKNQVQEPLPSGLLGPVELRSGWK